MLAEWYVFIISETVRAVALNGSGGGSKTWRNSSSGLDELICVKK